MKKLCALLAVVVICTLTLGCSSKYSTADATGDGPRVAYIGDQKEMLEQMHLVMVTTFPGRNISQINSGKVQGYSTWTRVLLDTYTQQALLMPVKAQNKRGEEVTAYAINVSGEGTSGSGYIKNKKLFKNLQEAFDGRYERVTPMY